ncbi:MAG: NAD(P)/FAD-dependent oxidoreductase [Alistipes senegalensis]|nr:NAD(P)/FAD-dependent oxidoreductase [Oxalobacter formigenes]MCM1281234.1 NAD(P)/FAD-dependent oxidoreductase [Alistipes senegalensis]
MLRLTEIRLPLDHTENALRAAITERLGISDSALKAYTIFRRNHDARKKHAVVFIYTIDAEVENEEAILARLGSNRQVQPAPDMHYHFVARRSKPPASRPVIIGCGPCGLFAALILAQSGFAPLILERGKPIRERTRDTFRFWRTRQLDPESNVQFGEGGAGTFSDGKLHTQIRDPKHYGRKVLAELVKAGAPEEILYAAKPHVGTFRLVKIIENIHRTIEELGGEFRFGCRVNDLLIENGRIRGAITAGETLIESRHIILAIGHSARDTFQMLHERGIGISPKPFSIGFRIEHPQSLIDQCRLGSLAGHPLLGAADYKLVHHCKNGRSVYSFCMCPGGTVVAAASEPGRLVTNGMSQYSRNERNANAAIVVGISPDDFPGHPLAGIHLQRQLEEKAFELGGGNYNAPCQLVGDFLAQKTSSQLGKVIPSYQPGVQPCSLNNLLPDYATEALCEALPAFDRKIPGFAMHDAVLTGVETRTSSPVRIWRNPDSLESVNLKGLYPAGEGAGYAGGILSSAVDGILAAEAVAQSINAKEEK